MQAGLWGDPQIQVGGCLSSPRCIEVLQAHNNPEPWGCKVLLQMGLELAGLTEHTRDTPCYGAAVRGHTVPRGTEVTTRDPSSAKHSSTPAGPTVCLPFAQH